MADELQKMPDVELLPVRQRIAWMAAVWLLSVGSMALASWLIREWLVG